MPLAATKSLKRSNRALMSAVALAAALCIAAPASAAPPKGKNKARLKIGRHLHMAKYLRLYEHNPKEAMKEYAAVLGRKLSFLPFIMAGVCQALPLSSPMVKLSLSSNR